MRLQSLYITESEQTIADLAKQITADFEKQFKQYNIFKYCGTDNSLDSMIKLVLSDGAINDNLFSSLSNDFKLKSNIVRVISLVGMHQIRGQKGVRKYFESEKFKASYNNILNDNFAFKASAALLNKYSPNSNMAKITLSSFKYQDQLCSPENILKIVNPYISEGAYRTALDVVNESYIKSAFKSVKDFFVGIASFFWSLTTGAFQSIAAGLQAGARASSQMVSGLGSQGSSRYSSQQTQLQQPTQNSTAQQELQQQQQLQPQQLQSQPSQPRQKPQRKAYNQDHMLSVINASSKALIAKANSGDESAKFVLSKANAIGALADFYEQQLRQIGFPKSIQLLMNEAKNIKGKYNLTDYSHAELVKSFN